MSLFPSETNTMNATVYCTRWWIRQRFITRFIQDYNSTYSYHIWYVYVLYSGVMTTTRGGAESWNSGGGVIPGGLYHNHTFSPSEYACVHIYLIDKIIFLFIVYGARQKNCILNGRGGGELVRVPTLFWEHFEPY